LHASELENALCAATVPVRHASLQNEVSAWDQQLPCFPYAAITATSPAGVDCATHAMNASHGSLGKGLGLPAAPESAVPADPAAPPLEGGLADDEPEAEPWAALPPAPVSSGLDGPSPELLQELAPRQADNNRARITALLRETATPEPRRVLNGFTIHLAIHAKTWTQGDRARHREKVADIKTTSVGSVLIRNLKTLKTGTRFAPTRASGLLQLT
jgi:hypothetical protein